MADAGKPTRTAPPASLGGILWFSGWMFTIGFAKLAWWKALLALVVWPYILGLIAYSSTHK
jgi:hypothetical protein